MDTDKTEENQKDVSSDKDVLLSAASENVPAIFTTANDNSTIYEIKGIWTKNTISAIEGEINSVGEILKTNDNKSAIILDLNQTAKVDTSGAFLISKIMEDAGEGGHNLTLKCDDEAVKTLIQKISSYKWNYNFDEVKYTGLAAFGKKVYDTLKRFSSELTSSLSFIGETMWGFAKAVTHPGHIRWVPTIAIAESAGLNAIPIVCILTFFIGAVISFMGAQTLNNFGATIFTVDLLGVSVLREFAVLITAILLAGRSDSAFTAQIGSMKMTQEIDAMATIGINPMEMLVIPRVIALLIMTPILVFFAMLAGIGGGALVAIFSLDISPTMFMSRLQEVGIKHFWCGMVKAPIFAFVIAIIGCRQGLMVGNDVISLGKNTTAAVVQAIFTVIVVDAIFAMIYNELNI